MIQSLNPARLEGETFADYKERRTANNGRRGVGTLLLIRGQHTADDNRKKRRVLIKAVGKRQFKKIYRGVRA